MTDNLPAAFGAGSGIPPMSASLRSQVRNIIHAGPYFPPEYEGDTGFRMRAEPVRYDPEAAAALPLAEHSCRPLDLGRVTVWIAKLATGAKRTPPSDEMRSRIAGIATACSRIPMGCFTDDTLTEALQKFEWFPSAAEMFRFMEPHAKELIATRDALRRICDAATQEPQPLLSYEGPVTRGEPTEAEKGHVSEVVRAFEAERGWNQKVGDKPQAKPNMLSDERLLIEYEQVMAANPKDHPAHSAAAFRAQWLRKKLGMPEPYRDDGR